MSKISLIIYGLSILIPLIIFFSAYRLSRLRDYNRTQKRSLHRLIYLISFALIILNIGIFYSARKDDKITKQEITNLLERNEKLQNEKEQLLRNDMQLRNDSIKLANENLTISSNYEGLSTKLQELRSIIYQKDQRINELENRIKKLELSVPQIKIK